MLVTASVVALGCGARTGTLFDGMSAGGANFGGYNAAGQASGGGAGGQGRAGTSGVGGSPTGGTSSVGGSGVGGHVGGNVGVGGAAAMGGVAPFGGTFGVAGSGAIGGLGEAGAGTGGIVDTCVAVAQSACDKCLCQSCGSQLNACFSDLGCALIFACVGRTQCNGFGCYQTATCRGVIDQFGGLTSGPVNEVFSLATCAVVTRTSCGCN